MPSESIAFMGLMCMVPGIVLESCGLFSPFWIKHDPTSDCFRGVVYNIDCPDNVKGLGSTVLALQAIFFTILVVVAISLLIMMRYNEEDCKNCGISLLIAYFLSGIVGLAGCIVAFTDFTEHDKGWSVYVSLAASCYVILPFAILGGGQPRKK